MMKIGADQKNCICQKGRSRRVGQTGCRGIIGIKTEQRAEYAICFVAVLVIKVEGLQIGKKLSEPGRADRGTDGRGRGKGGLIEPVSYTHLAYVQAGANDIAVYAEDDLRSGKQPHGKQSGLYYSHGCEYTRTTGIWQTVWLEFVPENYVKKARFFPNVEAGTLKMCIRDSRITEHVPVFRIGFYPFDQPLLAQLVVEL